MSKSSSNVTTWANLIACNLHKALKMQLSDIFKAQVQNMDKQNNLGLSFCCDLQLDLIAFLLRLLETRMSTAETLALCAALIGIGGTTKVLLKYKQSAC